jgi:folate-binding protein YgfZ
MSFDVLASKWIVMNEYDIAHERAGLVDRSTRGTVEVAGADRIVFLQGLLTNDIKSLVPGEGCYAAWLTPQGRMITDMRVVALDDRILIDVRAMDAPSIAHRLEQLIFSEDVQVEDLTDKISQIRVVGPGGPRAVIAALGTLTTGPLALTQHDLEHWSDYQSGTCVLDDVQVLVVRDDELGVMGYDVYILGSAHLAAAGRLQASLEGQGLAALDRQTTETLRIEAGRPLFGVDMDRETIPLEAGIENRAISFSKGCYVGQEVIVRVTSRGHGRVVRKLVGLVFDNPRVPARGDPLFADAREIGRVTSAAYSQAVGAPIALGYVHRDFAEPGTHVAIGRDGSEAGVVTPLPVRRLGRPDRLSPF